MKKMIISAVCAMLTACALAQKHSHRVVIEVSESSPDVYQSVLEHVQNLKNAFAPDPIQIEVVCHGPGINMLLAHDSSIGSRMKKADTAGAIFAACANTMKGRHITKQQLFPYVKVVPSGAAEVVRKE